ncbi:hypothetical protein E1180_19985 [Roseibium denhamense]|uniref:hypothetical protein n=1 Tax=Roseibium denhamense TaxID=76305 RepID=UPI0012BB8B30|nr:hypothetical protein [Roseibium denhamense]MTI07788.1 hypothetical protein [Roseibium denhamense]
MRSPTWMKLTSPLFPTATSANTIAEDASAGTQVGVTALATDSDITDSVAYAVDDGRFTVDENGVVTVADGASFDAEDRRVHRHHRHGTLHRRLNLHRDFHDCGLRRG